MKRLFIFMFLFSAIFLTACADKNVIQLKENIPLPNYNQMTEGQDYNSNLFYRNDLLVRGADPTAIYISEGDEAGYFYLYTTSDLISVRGIMAWKSRDMNNWEVVGVVFHPEEESWGRSSIWAPQIIYDESDQTYYLYYSAHNSNTAGGYNPTKYLGLATSKSPAGPFVQWTGTTLDGEEIGLGDPIFDLENLSHNHPLYAEGQSFIDACPFLNPNTGEKYLYMVRSRANALTNEIWGVKMKDWATPDYPTLTRLTTVNRTTVNGDEPTDLYAGVIDEGPFMNYAHGKYYLTLSINGTTDKNYAVVQAIGDTPLGPFTKIQNADGGLVLGAELGWDHVSCAGHHSFIEVGDELWIVYHQDLDREFGGTVRGIAIDRITWVLNDKGQYLMRAVGPTYSVQPLPSLVTGYRNIALEAKVTATNVKDGSSVDYLNDGLVQLHELSPIKEFEANAGKTTINLEFDDYMAARAILIYNSWDYYKSFVQIADITMSFKAEKDGKTILGKTSIKNLPFDFENYANVNFEMMRAGAAAIAEFDEILIKDIMITIFSPEGQDGIAISDIVVLGK